MSVSAFVRSRVNGTLISQLLGGGISGSSVRNGGPAHVSVTETIPKMSAAIVRQENMESYRPRRKSSLERNKYTNGQHETIMECVWVSTPS
jgi:hypothetical protein